MVAGNDVSEVPGDVRDVDEAQLDEGKTGVAFVVVTRVQERRGVVARGSAGVGEVELGVVESLRETVGKKVHWVHQIMVKERRPERGCGSPVLCRNRGITVAGAAYSDERFHRPGGGFSGDMRGGKWRRTRPFYSSNQGSF
jgi:hypothetical protein